MLTVYRIKHIRYHDGYVVLEPDLQSFVEEFKSMESGDPGFVVTKEQMNEQQYLKLKEFQGW